jgi:hypothetical protein
MKLLKNLAKLISENSKPKSEKPFRRATNATDAITNIRNALEEIDKQFEDDPEFEKAVMERLANEGKNKRKSKSATKTCPMCAEDVKNAAKVCRYCNHKFN